MASIQYPSVTALITPLAYETAYEDEAPPSPLGRPASQSDASAATSPAATSQPAASEGGSAPSVPAQRQGTFEHVQRFAAGAWNSTVGFALDSAQALAYDLPRAGVWLYQNKDLPPSQQSRPPQMSSHLMQAIENPTLPSITGNGPAHPLEHLLAVMPIVNTPYIAQDVLKAIRNEDSGHMAELAGGILGGALFMEATGVPGRIARAGAKVVETMKAPVKGQGLALAGVGEEGRAIAGESAGPQRSHSTGGGNGEPGRADGLHEDGITRNVEGSGTLESTLEDVEHLERIFAEHPEQGVSLLDLVYLMSDNGVKAMDHVPSEIRAHVVERTGVESFEQVVDLAKAGQIYEAFEFQSDDLHPLEVDSPEVEQTRARLIQPALDHLYRVAAREMKLASPEQARQVLGARIDAESFSGQRDIAEAVMLNRVPAFLNERLQTTGHSLKKFPLECPPIEPVTPKPKVSLPKLAGELDAVLRAREQNPGADPRTLAEHFHEAMGKSWGDLATFLSEDFREALREEMGVSSGAAVAVSMDAKLCADYLSGQSDLSPTEASERFGKALQPFYLLAARELNVRNTREAIRRLGHDKMPPTIAEVGSLLDSMIKGEARDVIRSQASAVEMSADKANKKGE